MRLKGFTVVELLTVIAIISITAALSFPALVAAKRRGQVEASVGILRQLHLGVKLYQENNGGEGPFGSPADMNLPTADVFGSVELYSPTHSSKLDSPCGRNQSWAQNDIIYFNYIYYFNDTTSVIKHINRFEDNLIMFYDPNCDVPGVPIYNPTFRHHMIGILYSGQVVRHFKAGDIREPEYWSQPLTN
jgi:prepilin-type N-terminal cleavage/methylation domain-containing protein